MGYCCLYYLKQRLEFSEQIRKTCLQVIKIAINSVYKTIFMTQFSNKDKKNNNLSSVVLSVRDTTL